MGTVWDYDGMAVLLDDWMADGEPRTIQEIAAFLDAPVDRARRGVWKHRHEFGSDSRGIVALPGEQYGPHYYVLTNDPAVLHDYGVRRLNDTKSRIETIQSLADRAVAFTDGRTKEGQEARVIRKYVDRMIEDLNELLNHA